MMLEPVARSGPARIIAWRRGDDVTHTPLLVAGIAGTPVDAGASHPRVAVTGGFLDDPPAPDGHAWAGVAAPRATRLAAQLALTRPLAAPEETAAETQTEPGLVLVADEVALVPGAAAVAGDARRLANLLVAARREAGPARLLYAPGTGLVHHVALLVYAGVDLLDPLAVQRATLDGWYLTPEGAHRAADLEAPLCPCATCAQAAPREMTREGLAAHNHAQLADELTRVAGHIRSDTLRGLVEMRARAHPGAAAFLRRLDAWRDHFAARWPLAATAPLYATTLESLARPDVARYRDRIRTDYRPPVGADVLLLLPCSATKPYARSKSHFVFRRILEETRGASRVHEVIVTSPLGVVPRELERTYPAAHYDVPVTGHYDGEETRMIRKQLASLLARGGYTRVISHLDPGTHKLVADLLPAATSVTGTPHPTAPAARDALRAALRAATRDGRAPAWPKRRFADGVASLAWQFGPAGAEAIAAACREASGRPPMRRLYADPERREAVATFVPARGLWTITLRGAQALLDAGCAKTVTIDDFTPRGTLFAVGVTAADPGIVPDDEVVIVHDGALRGVGRARMTGEEMVAFPRGAAVEVRHHA